MVKNQFWEIIQIKPLCIVFFINFKIIFNINQGIPNPAYFKSLIKLSESNIKSSELQLKVYQTELAANTKISYYQLSFWIEEIRLLKEMLAIYENVLRASALRYKTGETNALENYINDAKEENDTAIQRTGDLVSSLGTQIEKIDDKISQLESRIKYKRSLI